MPHLSALSLALNRPGAVGLTLEQAVAALFANNEQGAWYDPSDYSTMFQVWGGTAAVTNVEQPVGLLLDKRKGLALETALDTSFTNGWSAVAGGTVTDGDTFTCASVGGITKSLLTIGKVYKLTFSYVKTGLVTQFSINNESGATTRQLYAATAAAGSGTIYFYAQDTSLYFRCSAADTIDVTWSIQAIQGNHAYQTTSAARPVLRARYNLLTYSEQFDNGTAWGTQANGCTVVANATVAPDGTTTADKIEEDNSNFTHHRRGQSIGTGPERRFSIYAKKAERDYLRVWSFAGGDTTEQTFYLVGTGSATGTLSPTITPVGNGWYRCECNVPGANTTLVIGPAPVGNLNTTTYQGVAGSGIYIWGADLRVGTSAGDYQRIAAATDYATTSTITGQPFRPYLHFDGADGLLTANVDFTSTDAVSMCIGEQQIGANAAVEIGFELSGNSGNSGAFAYFSEFSPTPVFRSNGGTQANATAPSSSLLARVASGRADISDDVCILRINGAQVASVTTDQGAAASYVNQSLYIGSRSGILFPMSGNIYGLLVRGGSSTTDNLQTMETYMAGKTGVTL